MLLTRDNRRSVVFKDLHELLAGRSGGGYLVGRRVRGEVEDVRTQHPGVRASRAFATCSRLRRTCNATGMPASGDRWHPSGTADRLGGVRPTPGLSSSRTRRVPEHAIPLTHVAYASHDPGIGGPPMFAPHGRPSAVTAEHVPVGPPGPPPLQ